MSQEKLNPPDGLTVSNGVAVERNGRWIFNIKRDGKLIRCITKFGPLRQFARQEVIKQLIEEQEALKSSTSI